MTNRNEKGQIQVGSSGNLNGLKTDVTETAKKLPVSRQVVERLNALDFDPISYLVHLARNARSEKVQYEATAKLADKVAPSLRSVEIEGDGNSSGYTLNVFYRKDIGNISQDPHHKLMLTSHNIKKKYNDLALEEDEDAENDDS